MKYEFDSYETDIMSVFPCAIEYGDYSGLNDEEIESFENWMEDQPQDAVFEYAEEGGFGNCDILDIMGDVIHVTVNYNLHQERDNA